MSPFVTALFFLAITASSLAMASSTKQDLEMVQRAKSMVLQAMNMSLTLHGYHNQLIHGNTAKYKKYNEFYHQRVAWSDCAKLYGLAEPRLARMLENGERCNHEDALTWLSGALTSHRTCLDGLRERGVDEAQYLPLSQNLTEVLNEALALYAKKTNVVRRPKGPSQAQRRPRVDKYIWQLVSWNQANSTADIVVAKDGSGNYRSIKEAVDALPRTTASRGGKRVVVYVKAGVYDEKVEIKWNHKNVMFVGDGMDKTVVTGHSNIIDGDTIVGSATFVVFGDGFWARDMTFENIAGPQKHQAVALMVASDRSLFYQCSFKGYQDTLFVHSLRQFYRDCQIYGTIDFIFGNAAVVFQNCDIFVRRPMVHQGNVITAQGRESPNENTGISIHASRVRPAPEFASVKGSFKSFLGRPWRKYSRTIVAKTFLDRLIHPRGWIEWSGDFALSTLYYAEYMNTGPGASTTGRVKWPGFHVLRDPREVSPFTVRNFIQGASWITGSGVPFWYDI
ncbi:hypothetical protein Cgig2_033308 [Carnegiea gigantea]|uniref:Pectinesterase n=1 Tax=Carnegiea gigantea TaxID=171969 RepID=A0A9Q1KWD3_9CARY|nr:hypothetical protein Cgig2_033308 [Carnegiea gigantea]